MARLSPWLLTLACLGGPAALAADPAPAPPKPKDDRFKMGEVTVVVTDKAEALETVATRIDSERIQLFSRDTVASALELLPGVSLTVNSRNEQMLYVRGHDSRQVPVYLDGMPVYVPYDGEMDYGRFTTFDLASIQVAKGFSSVLYGPNTLGGAINLVTRRPTQAFEGRASLGAADGGGRKAAIEAGARRDRFYLQASGGYASQDGWRLPRDFTATPREDGGLRDNSMSTDRRVALRAGFTPNATDEYVLGFTNQAGDKGNPVCADPRIAANYWRWPSWDKRDVHLSSRTALGAKSDLVLRAFYDTYDNTIFEFTDGTYATLSTTGKLKPTGRSLYKDFSHGALAQFETTLVPGHSLRAVLQTKTDVHRENNGLVPDTSGWLHYQDSYLSAGLEDAVAVGKEVDLSVGAGWDRQRPERSGAWSLPAAKSLFHLQAGAFWKPAKDLQVYLTAAQKEHFPTLKDRYSLRLGTYVENPDLKAETSLNLELGAKAAFGPRLQAEAAVFWSDIRDLIQGVSLTQGPNAGMMQMQNIGKVRHSGFELNLDARPWDMLQAGLGYTYLDRDNLSSPGLKLTGTPRNRLSGYLKLQPLDSFRVLAAVQAQDGLWDNFSNLAKQSVTERLGGFTTLTLSAGWKPRKDLEFTAGLRNALDRAYQLSTGYPLPGRTWFVDARCQF